MVSGVWMVRGRELDGEEIRLKWMQVYLSRDSVWREGLEVVGTNCDS